MVIDFYILSILLQSHTNSTMAYRRREFIELEIIINVSPIKFLGVFKLRFFCLHFQYPGKHVNNGRLPHFIFNPQNVPSVFAVL